MSGQYPRAELSVHYILAQPSWASAYLRETSVSVSQNYESLFVERPLEEIKIHGNQSLQCRDGIYSVGPRRLSNIIGSEEAFKFFDQPVYACAIAKAYVMSQPLQAVRFAPTYAGLPSPASYCSR
jgi:hypothetical protein